jgi:hypothetical protein
MLKNGRIYPNSLVRISIRFTDADGTLTDPATVKFRTCDPCGRSVTYTYLTDPEIQKESTGVYYADVTPDRGGRWNYRWETTGPVFATEDSFIVINSPFYDTCCEDYV